MNEAEIYAALSVIFQDVFQRDDLILTPTLSANDVPGWDSFKQVEILIATEKQFGVKLSTDEIDRVTNVGDLVSALAARDRARPGNGGNAGSARATEG
jgi:acyl carrier protein